MPVIRCSLSVQAAGPRPRRSVSLRDRSGGTRLLHRFHERSHRASSAASSWSQLYRIGIAAGSAGAARSPGCAGAMGCGDPVPSGAHRGPRGASPAGMDPCWAPPPAPGGAPGASSCPSAWPAAWGGGRRVYGACHGTSGPALGGCGRPPPCHPPELQRAPRATPGVPASPRFCSTCLNKGDISLVLWPLAPGGAAPTFGWRPPALVRRADWPAKPCVALTRGLGPPHRGLLLRVRVRDSGRRCASRLPAATLASAWRRFGGRACPSIAGRGRLVASGTLWSGPPAGVLGRRGAPPLATLPASLPWRCPSVGPGAEGRVVRPSAAP